MRGFFGSRKSQEAPAPEPPPAEPEAEDHRFDKEIEIYPVAVKALWHFYVPTDQGKPTATLKELPGPIDESVSDSVEELEKMGLIDIESGFEEFGIHAKMTPLGLQVMAPQTEAGHLKAVRITNPQTRQSTVYKEVNMQY
jgi:hypothetical protein